MRIAPASVGFTLLLSGIAALPPLSIDMSLPALQVIGRELSAPAARTGLTLSLFMVGYAIAQLVFGPLSDRFGRRWPLLAGTLLFAVGALGAALSADIFALLAWRVVQGAGAGAGTALAFAIVRDLFTGASARVKISTITAVLNLAPLIAPTLGGVVLAALGWRPIYLVQAVAGAALCIAILIGFGESNGRPDPRALAPGRLLRSYGRALSHPVTLGYSVLGGLSFGALFAYVTGAPFVFIPLVGLRLFGALFAGTAAGLVVGAMLSGVMARRGISARRMLTLGLAVAFACHAALLVLAVAGAFSLSATLPLLILGMVAIGFVMPNAVHGALEPFPDMAGTASALRGCLQMVGGAASSALVAELYRGTPMAMALVMALCSAAALAVWVAVLQPVTRTQPAGHA